MGGAWSPFIRELLVRADLRSLGLLLALTPSMMPVGSQKFLALLLLGFTFACGDERPAEHEAEVQPELEPPPARLDAGSATTCLDGDKVYAVDEIVWRSTGVSCTCLPDGKLGRCTGALTP
jgi:hypothetical protein